MHVVIMDWIEERGDLRNRGRGATDTPLDGGLGHPLAQVIQAIGHDKAPIGPSISTGCIRFPAALVSGHTAGTGGNTYSTYPKSVNTIYHL